MLQRTRGSLLSINRLLRKDDALSGRAMLSGRPWICASCRQRTITSPRHYAQVTSSQPSSSDYALDDKTLESFQAMSIAEPLSSQFQKSGFLTSDSDLPPLTLVPKERLKPLQQDHVSERTSTMSNNKKRKLLHSKPSKIPKNIRDISLQRRLYDLKLALKPALYTSTLSERSLRTIATKFQTTVKTWYKHARYSVPLRTTAFSDKVTLPDGTEWTILELCIQLLCRYHAKVKSMHRNDMYRLYESLRDAAPELLGPFQQAVILAMTQENELHQAQTWARRFIQESNLVSAAFLNPLIARLIQVPFGLAGARSLAEDAFKLAGFDADVAYLVCLGVAKSSDASDIPVIVEEFASQQGSVPQERFVNILYNLARRSKNEVVIDLYLFWRTHFIKAQDPSEREKLQKTGAAIYTIVLKAILNRYPRPSDAASMRDSGSTLPHQLKQLLENMIEDGIPLDAPMLTSLIAGLGSAKELELALQTAHFALSTVRGKYERGGIAKTLVRLLLDEGRRDEAEVLLRKNGVPETINMHNLFIRMILHYNPFDKSSAPTPEAFSEAMTHFREKIGKPNRNVAKNLMVAALRLEDIEAAFEVLKVTGRNGDPKLWQGLLVHITRDVYKRATNAMRGEGSPEELQESIDMLQKVVVAAIEVWMAHEPRKYEVNQAFKEIFQPRILRKILGVSFLPMGPNVRVDFDQGRRDMEAMLDVLRAGKVYVDHGMVEAVVKNAIDGKLM